jgi:hypothetical protein
VCLGGILMSTTAMSGFDNATARINSSTSVA